MIKQYSPTIIIDLHHNITKKNHETIIIIKTLKNMGYFLKKLDLKDNVVENNIDNLTSFIAFKKISKFNTFFNT